uniref:phytol kinase n=1 Tax=Aegilops tauschii subsp. strangulata TaxID=200361 RepID=A0A453SMW3_AEGTS
PLYLYIRAYCTRSIYRELRNLPHSPPPRPRCCSRAPSPPPEGVARRRRRRPGRGGGARGLGAGAGDAAAGRRRHAARHRRGLLPRARLRRAHRAPHRPTGLAELEQEGCACAIRDLFHGFMATLQQFDRCTVLRGVVPFLNCVRLLAYGLSFYSDEALVKSVTREGKREELLRGPLYYVIVLLIIVLVFWRDSPIGIVSLSMISGGDGFADIVGRRFGSLKLPFNDKKSWVGVAQCSYLGSCCPL